MNMIQTPYGPKTPELLCKAMDALVVQPNLIKALKSLITPPDEYGHAGISYSPEKADKAFAILKRIEG